MILKVNEIPKNDAFNTVVYVLFFIFVFWFPSGDEHSVRSLSAILPALVFFVAFMFIREKRKIEILVFELTACEVRYNFYLDARAHKINLDKVDTVKYRDDLIVFEGEYPYSYEVFFPRKFRQNIPEILRELDANGRFNFIKIP